MAVDGHAPTHGPCNALYNIGQGICPECRGELTNATDGGVRCLSCDETYPVGGVGE